ncbi:hypothetical protein A3A39_03810 [Candidatus Kaiserbacteria bacterium RIFCSPLOWO2_01_FULL_54_13]|uniref:DUF8173 domain-containing protein n=1 Tax=Candidatus Kaiserbacteria bacterium RIFCSPLOWO2_01_FULL_54_13 TaxID=1798512 RepID=A0A1F6F229_9BACT|nr:MAG: hypothetical protein A3A39_03810 [Candidatus Kaiserbacteria bacterium RIFCSPLOWO2_01_FULL_54_13]
MRSSMAIRTFVGVVSLIVLAVASVAYVAGAAEVRTGDQPSIGARETVTDDIYIAGGNISSAGILRGDLIAAGGNIVVDGRVAGDAAAAGGAVTILADIADDVRVAGGNILINGSVGGDVVFGGGQVVLGGAGIRGDVLGGGGTIRIDAPVSGDVRLAGGNIFLNSAVSGNVEVYAEELTLGSAARIAGNLTYTAAKEVSMEEGATVGGEVAFTERERAISVGGIVTIISFALIGTFLSQLAAALLLGLVFRRYATRLVENASEQPLLEMGRGLIVFIVLPVISAGLLFSVIGIPLGVFGFLTFAATVIFLWILTPVLLGSFAYRSFFGGEFDVNWKTILLGVFIYTMLGLIPIVGWLVQFILMLLTLGASAKMKWEVIKEWR